MPDHVHQKDLPTRSITTSIRSSVPINTPSTSSRNIISHSAPLPRILREIPNTFSTHSTLLSTYISYIPPKCAAKWPANSTVGTPSTIRPSASSTPCPRAFLHPSSNAPSSSATPKMSRVVASSMVVALRPSESRCLGGYRRSSWNSWV
jgi:hypothetical protein